MLEDLKPEIVALQGRLTEMEKALDVAHKEEKIAELEYKMGEPTFWDNPEEAQKINQELNDVKISVDKYKALVAKYDDVQVMWELGMEDKDESLEADVVADMEAINKSLEELQLEVLLSGKYDANNAILTLHAGAGGPQLPAARRRRGREVLPAARFPASKGGGPWLRHHRRHEPGVLHPEPRHRRHGDLRQLHEQGSHSHRRLRPSPSLPEPWRRRTPYHCPQSLCSMPFSRRPPPSCLQERTLRKQGNCSIKAKPCPSRKGMF